MRPFSVRRDAVPLIVAGGVLAVLTAFALPYYLGYAARAPLPDFHAFYCAGRALLAHSDPYRQQPLASCEAPLLSAYFPAGSRGVVIPAPLPPFAFALVLPFALLPFNAAAALWLIVLAAAIGTTMRIIRRLTGFSWPLVVVLVLCCDGASALALGQLTPLSLLGLAASALALRGDKPQAAAWWLLPLWFVPQAAVAVTAAMLLVVPRARISIVISIFALLVTGFALCGPALMYEYLPYVVPLQVRAELPYAQQLALAPQLFQLGISAKIAAALGTLVWLAVSLLGIALAGRVRRLDPALVVTVPCALALLGGAYLHPASLALALPAAALCATRQELRFLGGTALILTAVPWMPSGVTLFLCPLLALAILLVTAEIFSFDASRAIAAAFAAFALLIAIDVQLLAHNAALHALTIETNDGAFAQVAWDAIVRSSWAQPVTSGVWFARTCAAAGVLAIAFAVGTLPGSAGEAAFQRT